MTRKSPPLPDSPMPTARSQSTWEFLGGVKFAVGLLLVWALVASVGTFIPQGRSPQEYQEMLGSWSALALAVGLDHMYYTPWFLALLGMFCINLMISITLRVRRLQREDRAVKVECPSQGLAKVALRVSLPEGLEAASRRVEDALRGLGLGFRRAEANGEVYYYAERGRLRRWGSTWAHVGLLVIFLGALFGRWPGIGYNGYLNIMEGSSERVPAGDRGAPTAMVLKVHGFQVVGDETGRPRDFVCDLELLDDGRSIERKTIRVNTPLQYGTTTFYQAGYGMAGFRIHRTDASGKRHTFQISTGQQGEVDPRNGFLFPETKGSIFAINQFYPHARVEGGQVVPVSALPVAPAAEIYENPDPQKDPMGFKPLGWLVPGQKLKASDGSVLELGTLALFTGIQYRRDPGYGVVALGFVIATLGLMASFYIGHRRVRIALAPGPEQTFCYVAGVPGTPGNDPGQLPERLAERLGAPAPPEPRRN